nr:tail fiber domain-containing protein [Candidatus Buchananbacteria bacterium]
VVIRAGGADRMYIDNSTGFVGIGTSSPTQLLELRTSGALGPVIKLDAAESGAGAWALVAKASGNLATGGFGIYDFDALAYRLNITADGYVGVGTTTPLDKLVVENTGNANNYRMLRLQNYSTGNAAVSGMEINAGANANGALLYMRGSGYSTDPNSFWINNVTAAPIVLATNNSERLRVTSVGSVGINNTAPYSMLDVATTTNVTGQTNVLTIRNNSITASTEAGIFFSPSTAVGNIRGATISGVQEDGSNSIGLRLRTSVGGVFNEAVTVRSSGYIGIGTTTPNRHLTVWKSGIRGEILLADGSATVDTSTQGGTYLSSDQGLFNIQGMNSQGSGTGSFFTVDQVNARVGVGTTAPEGSLEVQAAEATAASLYLDADDGDDVADTWVLQALTTNNFTLTNGATEVLALTTAGNLQIDGTIDVGSFAASDDTSRWVCIDAAGNSTLQAGVNAASGDCDTSSVTVKHDINDLSINGLDTLRTLRPVSFIYNNDVTNTITWGFVAEEVDAIDQALAGHNTDGDPRSIQKNAIMAVLTKAMQELTIEVDVLKSNASSPAPLAVSGGGTGSFNHLTVTQTATFYGMITVHGQANFMSKVVFSEDVEIEGHLTLGNDTSGTATIEKDEDSIEVIFDEPYLMAPRIILTPQGPLGGREYWVSDKSETGFTIKIDGQVDEDFDFDWLAIAPWGTTDEPVVIDQPDTNATDTTEPESDVSEPVTETTVVNPDSDEPIVTETTVVNPDSSEEVSSADEPIVTESTEPTTVVNPDSSEEVSSTDAPIATESSQPSTTE